MVSSRRRVLLIIVAFMTTLVVGGCAQRKVAMKDGEDIGTPQPATLKTVVSADGTIDVRLDRPVPYTFYRVENPLRGVIDFSQATSGAIPATVVPTGKGKTVSVSSVKTAGLDTVRLEFPLQPGEEVDLGVDPTEKGKVSVRFTVPPPAVSTASQNPATTPPAEPVSEPATASVSTSAAVSSPDQASSLRLTSIDATATGILLKTSGEPVNYNSFRLSNPERLVVDLFSTSNGLPSPTVAVGAFGISQARIGRTADKIRVVFDAEKGNIPSHTVQKTSGGILLSFVTQDEKTTSQTPAAVAVEVPATGSQGDLPPSVPSTVTKAEPVAKPSSAEPAPARVEPPPAGSPPLPVTPPPAPVLVPGSVGDPMVSPIPAAPPQTVGRSGAAVESIDFTVVDGYSRIAVRAGKGCSPTTPVKTKDGVVLTIAGCRMPKHLQRYIDTSAFQSVVLGVTPYEVKGKKKGNDAKLLAKLRADAPTRLSVAGDVILWEIKNTEFPPPKEPVKKSVQAIDPQPRPETAEALPLPPSTTDRKEPTQGGKVYTGRRVTLEFSDADIRKIFQLIAEVSNLNFLIADDVTGQISIKLVNVPWDQALDVILETKQLAMKREGNIVQIMPKSKMVSREEEERQAREAIEKGMELKTVIFDVNYAKIDDVASQFNAIKSKRGTITKDSRTNRIIVKDIQPAIDDMKFLLKNLDLPERQVMIEARIVEASSNFTRDLGVKWSTSYLDGSASKLNINAIDSSFGGVVSSTLPTTTTGGLAMGMSFGKLTSNVQLDMRLSAAATIGQVKVISTPKVLTLNNKKAKISQGQSVPYQTVSAEGTKTEFVEAVLTLEVTPHITSDGSVSMEIKASNNSVGSGTPPPINKKEATTELVLKNGETTVIGGIYIDSDTTTETGVPFLMDIPLLGWLFKSNAKNKTRTELLIFITPKVIS